MYGAAVFEEGYAIVKAQRDNLFSEETKVELMAALSGVLPSESLAGDFLNICSV